jgi:hypothetical protein
MKKSPLRPTRFRFSDSTASLNKLSPVDETPETLYCSHSIGAFTCSKMSLTELVISSPIPSPGIKVTV